MFGSEKIDIAQASNFKEIFDRYYCALCLFAERYLDSPEDAADTVQDVFLKLWQRRHDFNHLYTVVSFLYTAIRNASLNRLAHLKVKEKYQSRISNRYDDGFFHDQIIEQECFKLLWEAIRALPNQTRNVVLLALEGNNNGEIATALGITRETVHSHKKIAYKRLRNQLKDIFLLLLFGFLG